eukprot:GHVR01105771.1.p1 GENE.GHVR01105771.1~~GHVR01105771.1.p1  ORF type:complete len:125 (+),score=2.24 GHVR01105771.1:311-685(+)
MSIDLQKIAFSVSFDFKPVWRTFTSCCSISTLIRFYLDNSRVYATLIRFYLDNSRVYATLINAQCMLEYDLDEAEEVLNKNLKASENSVQVINGDLNFLTEQKTMTDVNRSRIHNELVIKGKLK